MQIVVSNVQVRHGLLMLVPETIQVLGGMVEELEEARKRLVIEVNKPPRGIRLDFFRELFRSWYFLQLEEVVSWCLFSWNYYLLQLELTWYIIQFMLPPLTSYSEVVSWCLFIWNYQVFRYFLIGF